MSDSAIKDLQTAIEAALSSSRGHWKSREELFYLFRSNDADYGFSALVDKIESSKLFECFSGHLQFLGFWGTATNYDELAMWFVARSAEVGVEQAISEALEYVSSDKVVVYQIMPLVGADVDIEYFKFCNDVCLADLNHLPCSPLAQHLADRMFTSGVGEESVSCTLFKSFEQPVHHEDTAQERPSKYEVEPPTGDLEDVLLCLSLARPPKYGISANTSGTVASDDLPFFRPFGAWSLRPSKKAGMSPSIIELEVTQADQILGQFLSLKKSTREKLRIPLERLNSFGLFASEADQAIDIRVCMEALFLDDLDKGGEIRFRLALRAAHYLGGTDEEKRSIKKAIRKAYDAASAAVHKGKFKTDNDRKAITEVAPILRKTLLKKISQENVEWPDVELGIL